MAFYTGQKVVYVSRNCTTDDHPGPFPMKGRIYTVARYYITWCGEASLELVELHAPETEEFCAGYAAADFRPIVEKKTDISIFKKMLLPKSNRRSLETVA